MYRVRTSGAWKFSAGSLVSWVQVSQDGKSNRGSICDVLVKLKLWRNAESQRNECTSGTESLSANKF